MEAPTVYDDKTTDVGVSAVLAYLRQTRGPKGEHGFPRAPYHLEISSTSICQIDCQHCSYEIRNAAGNRLLQDILAGVIEDARALGVVGTYFSGGGEPTLTRGIDSMVASAAEFSGVAIQTNGVSLDRLLRHEGTWFNRTCDLISWSIYAHCEELFADICRADAAKFRKMVENMRTAAEYRDQWGQESHDLPPTHLSSKIVISRENHRHLPAILEFARGFRPDTIHLRLVSNFEPGQDVALTPAQLEDLQSMVRGSADPLLQALGETLAPRETPRTDCPPYSLRAGLNAIVETDGSVFLSIPSDGDRRYSIGNVNEERLAELWGAPRHLEVLEALEKAPRAPIAKDRHHKADLAIHEYLSGSRPVQLTPSLLTPHSLRLHQRAQL